jgi:hypothetical protein
LTDESQQHNDADADDECVTAEELAAAEAGEEEEGTADYLEDVETADSAAQCTDVVILTNDEFNHLKRQGGTPTAPSLRPCSGSRIGTPKKSSERSGLPPSRPTTAAMKQLTATLGYQLPNKDYEDAVMQLCAIVQPSQPPESPEYQGDLNTARLLQQVAGLCNARFLLHMRESEQEQQLKLHAVSTLSSLLSDFGCTDSAALPCPVPYFLVTEWSREDMEHRTEIRAATAIRDAFAPVMNAIADACQRNRIASRSGGKKQTAADLEALNVKVAELDELLRKTAQHVGVLEPARCQDSGSDFLRGSFVRLGSGPGTVSSSLDLPAGSKPPLARRRLPSMIDDGLESLGGSDDDEGPPERCERRLLSELARHPSRRVLVKPLSKTASIRKTMSLDPGAAHGSSPSELSAFRVSASTRTPPQALRPINQQRQDGAVEIVRRSNSPPLSQLKKRGLLPLTGSPPPSAGNVDVLPCSAVLEGLTEAFMERFAKTPK